MDIDINDEIVLDALRVVSPAYLPYERIASVVRTFPRTSYSSAPVVDTRTRPLGITIRAQS
jgi:hypothetical protein